MNICWCASIWIQTRTRAHKYSHILLHSRMHRSLVPLLVTCNYVAMMSLIFCIGWKLPDAERLESTGKCRAGWNTNMLICEHWLKGKCFSMHPRCWCLPPQGWNWREDRPTDWLSDWLNDWVSEWLAGWLSPDRHVGSWLPDKPIDRPRGPEWTERKRK